MQDRKRLEEQIAQEEKISGLASDLDTLFELAREGEIALRTAEQEAAALQAEGARKAEAMEKLFAAYEHGGEGLVKEQLMKLYEGVTVRARPYALSERVDQIQTQAVRSAVQPPPAAPQGK